MLMSVSLIRSVTVSSALLLDAAERCAVLQPKTSLLLLQLFVVYMEVTDTSADICTTSAAFRLHKVALVEMF